MAVEAVRHVTSRTTDTAADIEQILAGRYWKPVCEIDGARQTASVELINRGQVGYRNTFKFDSRILQSLENSIQCIPLGPIVRDCIRAGNVVSPFEKLFVNTQCSWRRS